MNRLLTQAGWKGFVQSRSLSFGMEENLNFCENYGHSGRKTIDFELRIVSSIVDSKSYS